MIAFRTFFCNVFVYSCFEFVVLNTSDSTLVTQCSNCFNSVFGLAFFTASKLFVIES